MRTENSSIHSNKIQELTSSISAISKSTFKILLSCMLLLFLSLNLSGQSLNGAYTIGTSPSDFQTCTDAVNSLIQKGVSGPVIFKLKSGTYTEQFSIPYIKGTEYGNVISFESETGKKEDVIISFTGNTTKNYIILLDSAQQINFKNITLKPLSIANGTAVKLSRECRDITFENNNFTGLIPVTPTASLSLIMTAQDFKGINIQFTNNTFYGGLGGIYLGTKQQEYSLGTIIKNNTFQNQSNYAIYLASHDQLKVSSNKISSQSNENEYTGILLNFCYRSPEIKSNLINSKTGRGIHLYSCEGSSEKFALVANNMIMVSGGTWQIMGIYNDKSKYLSFLNNTILVNGSYSGNHGLASYSTSDSSVTTTLKVYNNIIINQSKGYSDAYAFAHAGKVECDYNNLMSNGTFLAYGYQNLADLQKGTKYDAHSYSQNPLFKSATDLHINKGLFKGTGFPFAEITDDIDGDVRPALPAIGADEFTPQGLNADLYKIILPQVPFTAGTHPIKVEVRNSGAGELTSLKIYWRLNAVMQNPVAWTGSLNTGSGTTVKLADFPFLPLVSYKVEAWVSEPNGGIDIETANDTILTPAFNTALSGNYSISKINGDFISFSEAAKRLVAGGITGPVNFNVAGGTYNEQFILKEIPGNSCDNMVTFQAAPSATVIIENYSGSANNYIIKLEKARGLTFKDLTIRPTNTNYGTAINIEKGASCISFLNNKIQGPQVNDRSVNTYLVTSTKDYFQYTGASSRINFKGNVFTGGTTAIDIPWESGYPDDSAIVIEDNQFSNQYYSVIEIQNQKSSIIKGNTISGSYYGIRISGNLSGFTIEKNKIATLGEAMTISSSSEKINSNGIIANNFISSISGISIYGLKEVRVYHNTVFGKGTRFYDYAFSVRETDTLKSFNNIFYGNGKYISSISTKKPELCHSDYNSYFTSNHSIFSFNSKETESFAEFQKISSQDKNSVFADPLFKSTEDLHVNKALLYNTGIKIPEITTDIDNELRDQLPDIGADEFTPTGNDASVVGIIAPSAPFAKGEYPIKVVIKNVGITSLTSVNINWGIEEQQPLYNWTGSLKTGETDTVAIGNYNFEKAKIHYVYALTELPNGTADIGPSDDNFTRNDICPAIQGNFIVGRTGETDFPDLEYAINTLTSGGISGPVTFTIQPETYYDEFIIPDFPGSSCDKPVVFKSENNDSTSVILKSYPNKEKPYGLQLIGAKGITFQGMTFQTSGYEFTSNLLLTNGASCNKFISNVFDNADYNSEYYTNPAIRSDSESDSTAANINNHFENNLIKNGSHGFFISGDSSKNENHRLVLKNNKLENQHIGGIYLKALNNVSVIGNSISGNTKLKKFPVPFKAIYIDKFKEYFTVTENKIESDGIGIGVSDTKTSTKSALIANNFAVMKGTDTCQALQISNTENLNIYHNSVNILNTNTASTAFKTNNVKGIKVYNNNIVQTGGGSIFQIDNAATTTSDYNNLFTTSSKFAISTQEIGNLNT